MTCGILIPSPSQSVHRNYQHIQLSACAKYRDLPVRVYLYLYSIYIYPPCIKIFYVLGKPAATMSPLSRRCCTPTLPQSYQDTMSTLNLTPRDDIAHASTASVMTSSMSVSNPTPTHHSILFVEPTNSLLGFSNSSSTLAKSDCPLSVLAVGLQGKSDSTTALKSGIVGGCVALLGLVLLCMIYCLALRPRMMQLRLLKKRKGAGTTEGEPKLSHRASCAFNVLPDQRTSVPHTPLLLLPMASALHDPPRNPSPPLLTTTPHLVLVLTVSAAHWMMAPPTFPHIFTMNRLFIIFIALLRTHQHTLPISVTTLPYPSRTAQPQYRARYFPRVLGDRPYASVPARARSASGQSRNGLLNERFRLTKKIAWRNRTRYGAFTRL